MRVVGIDPGVATTGLGLVTVDERGEITHPDWLTIETPVGLPLAERLAEIEQDLSAFLTEKKPDLAVVERLFFSRNERTAIDVAQARGVILLTLQTHGIPYLEPTPPALKSAITGDGRADKKQIQSMLRTILKLSEIPKPDDAADALAIAICGVNNKIG